MSENDFTGDTAGEDHGKHHGTTGSGGHTDDGNTHAQGSTHEDGKDGHRHDENQLTERNRNIMRGKTTQTLTGLALALFFFLGTTPGYCGGVTSGGGYFGSQTDAIGGGGVVASFGGGGFAGNSFVWSGPTEALESGTKGSFGKDITFLGAPDGGIYEGPGLIPGGKTVGGTGIYFTGRQGGGIWSGDGELGFFGSGSGQGSSFRGGVRTGLQGGSFVVVF